MDGFLKDTTLSGDGKNSATCTGPTDGSSIADRLLGNTSPITLASLDGSSTGVNKDLVTSASLTSLIEPLPAVTLARYTPDQADHIPRPPKDLNTGQKVAGMVDLGGALGGGFFAMKTFQRDGLQVLQTDLRSLDKFPATPEFEQFRSLGSDLTRKIADVSRVSQDDALAMQFSKPHLFNQTGSVGVWRNTNLRAPIYEAMTESEAAVVDRAADLRYLSDTLYKATNYSSPAQFKVGVEAIQGLHTNPVAVSEGWAPELLQLEDLGRTVADQATGNSLSMVSQSRSVFMRNLGVVGAGIATNYVVDKTLLKNSAPSILTIGTDVATPFVVLTDLPIWAKFGVIVGAHAAARLAEYGMREAGKDES